MPFDQAAVMCFILSTALETKLKSHRGATEPLYSPCTTGPASSACAYTSSISRR